jgi:hypothetical protein
MKFLETHYEDYVNSVSRYNLHPKLEKYVSRFPSSLNRFRNIIIYGTNGIGKYSQMLNIIKKYSPSHLKYEKKMEIISEKEPYFIKISDIHYEIDMSLLGCNSKVLWHEIYIRIVESLTLKIDKIGIIVCKEFHKIHNELLEAFYSYMQNNNLSIDIKFILLTDEISFIPDNILNCCEVVHLQRPPKVSYMKCANTTKKDFNVEDIQNIKSLFIKSFEMSKPYKIICDKLLNDMIYIDQCKFIKFRDNIYDIFIYNLNVHECMWYVLTSLVIQSKIKKCDLSRILFKTFNFFKFFNNNYRPIYHLESYLFYLVNIIHGY